MPPALRPLLRPLRVGVVGARRRRQGTGAYLARFLAAEGAVVAGLVGTTEQTAREASEALAADGIQVRPYVDATRLLEAEDLDALVIASPHESHDEFLTLAAEAGLHVLCEKPLCWGGDDPAGRARRHAGRFLTRGLHLMVQTQWPETLATYDRLYPGVRCGTWRTFRMALSPSSRGRRMIPDAVPHALSLLAATLPDPAAEVLQPRIERTLHDGVRVSFDYLAAGRRVEAVLELAPGDATPRPASYGFDGRVAHRDVDPGTYRMALRGEGECLVLPDPTPLLVGRFVSRVRSGASPRVDPGAVPGLAHLVRLASAWDVEPS